MGRRSGNRAKENGKKIKKILLEQGPQTAPDIVMAMKNEWKTIPSTRQTLGILSQSPEFVRIDTITVEASGGQKYGVAVWGINEVYVEEE